MTDHVASALFVYTEDTIHHIKQLQDNSLGVRVTSVEFDVFMQKPKAWLEGVDHVVVAGSHDVIKTVLTLGMKYPFSVGIIPAESQRDLIKFYDLPKNPSAAIDLALRKDGYPIDLVLCNGKIVLFKATVGRVPLLDTRAGTRWIPVFSSVLRELLRLKLYSFEFNTAGRQSFNTAATGCVIIQSHTGISASRLIAHDNSITDGMVSMVISSPISIVDYFRLLAQALISSKEYTALPQSIGYVKSPLVDIESENRLDVFVDDQRATLTPLHCEAIPKAVRVNIGKNLMEDSGGARMLKKKLISATSPIKTSCIRPRGKREFLFFLMPRLSAFENSLRRCARMPGSMGSILF